MIKVITENRVPIKCWTNDIEVGAMKQANNLANLPFTFKHVALMPDCHEGYGMPIGGVLATKGVIVPNAVGVDIGCGMCAVKLENVTDIDKQTLMDIFYEIKNRVPVGFVHHIEKQPIECMPNLPIDNLKIVGQEFENARYQVGTLGGGNHFIEIQKEVTEGSDGNIWIMLHSGSRNLGKKVADYYNKIAQNLNATWFSEVKKETDLAFLPIQSNEGKAYFDEMKYCVDFGFCNRKLIMETMFLKS